MSDFVHDPTPVVAVINQPEGAVMVTQENSDMMHRTAEQTAEEMALKQEHAEEITKLQEEHMVANQTIAEGTPVEAPEVVHYRASTVDSDKAAVDMLFAEHKISEEGRDARHKEIDEAAAAAEKADKEANKASAETTKRAEKEETKTPEKK